MERDVGDLSPNDQIQCMKNALGERRGHMKGIGHVVSLRVEEQVQRNEQEFHRRVEEQVQRKVNQQLEQLQEEMRRQFNQQLEQIASTFKRKEQVINRQFRLLPCNCGESSGRCDYRGDILTK
ncbi:hypothetical protein Hanom_Chr07g00633561 [Helianthus anomalus]